MNDKAINLSIYQTTATSKGYTAGSLNCVKYCTCLHTLTSHTCVSSAHQYSILTGVITTDLSPWPVSDSKTTSYPSPVPVSQVHQVQTCDFAPWPVPPACCHAHPNTRRERERERRESDEKCGFVWKSLWFSSTLWKLFSLSSVSSRGLYPVLHKCVIVPSL